MLDWHHKILADTRIPTDIAGLIGKRFTCADGSVRKDGDKDEVYLVTGVNFCAGHLQLIIEGNDPTGTHDNLHHAFLRYDAHRGVWALFDTVYDVVLGQKSNIRWEARRVPITWL